MKRINTVVVIGVCALTFTSGCTGSDQPDAAPPPSSGSTATPSADPKQILEAAQRQVRQATGITFDARSVSSVDNAVTTRDITGAWVSKPAAWKTTTVIDAPPASWYIPKRYVDRTDRFRYVGSRLYFANPNNKSSSSDWLDVTPSTNFVPFEGMALPKPAEVRLLFQFEPANTDTNADAMSMTGTIPNKVAIDTLGLAGQATEIGLLEEFHDGRTTVRLTLDESGFPATLEFLGADVNVTSTAIPAYRRAELNASSFRIEYRPQSKPLVIAVPMSAEQA